MLDLIPWLIGSRSQESEIMGLFGTLATYDHVVLSECLARVVKVRLLDYIACR